MTVDNDLPDEGVNQWAQQELTPKCKLCGHDRSDHYTTFQQCRVVVSDAKPFFCNCTGYQ
jgi:hypothetical protein